MARMMGGSLPAPLDGLAKAVAGVGRVLVYCHMNPDPDSLGSALAMEQVLAEGFGKKTATCYRGIVGRAENRRVVELLAPRMSPARRVDQSGYDAAFLVDAQPDFGYLPELDKLPLLGCVDHHPWTASTGALPYHDVRSGYGSTCTILVEYLRTFGLEPDARVATALFYGIKTDTLDLSRRTGERDLDAYEWLFRRVDRGLLAQVQNPPLDRAYFEELRKGIGRAVTYRRAVLTELGRVSYPDMVAEIADRLLRLEGMQTSVCFGAHEGRLHVSVRTSNPDADAGTIVRAILGDDGVGGGHAQMAAGRVEMGDVPREVYLATVSRLWKRFLRHEGESAASGRTLLTAEVPTIRVDLAE